MLMFHLYIPMFLFVMHHPCDTCTLGSSGSLVGNVPLDRRESDQDRGWGAVFLLL